MSYYPNQQPGQQNQAPWPGYTAPSYQGNTSLPIGQSLPTNPYGAGNGTSAMSLTNPYQQGTSRQRRPYILALLAFPFQCLKVYLLPSPTTFAGEKDRAGWGLIFSELLVFAALAGALAWLWGRLPNLSAEVRLLSNGRVVPQALSVGVCIGVAVAAPLAWLLLIGAMHQFAKKLGGKGTYRAQNYTTLLITAPLLLVTLCVLFVLLYNPLPGSSLRVVSISVELIVLSYSIVLHILAAMAVQQLGIGKAALVVLCSGLVLFALIAIAILFLMAFDGSSSGSGSSSGDSSHSGGGNSHSSDKGGSGNAQGASSVGAAAQAGAVAHTSQSGSSQRSDFFDYNQNEGGARPGSASARPTFRFCANCGLQLPMSAWNMQGPCPRCGMPTTGA